MGTGGANSLSQPPLLTIDAPCFRPYGHSMTPAESFRLPERYVEATRLLATWGSALDDSPLPPAVARRTSFVLTDLLGVTVAGMRTPELGRLLAAWPRPQGAAPLVGTGETSDPETSAFLGAVAACVLELDEGNKHAAGHPAAHVVFAAVAAAQLSPAAVSGQRLLSAVVVGYEVAARFGRAVDLRAGWHPHGHWGATGAAAAAALVLGAGAGQVAAAIDSAAGLMQVTPWGTVLAGDFTRNLWIAGAGAAGLHAARLAMAGLVDNVGSVRHSLGDLAGDLDPDVLVAGLDSDDLLITRGYLKQYAACSYTHSAIDLVASLRAVRPWQVDEIAGVHVRTHSLARPLLARHPRNRLAAMFSLPFVVANAVVNGRVDPMTMQPGTTAFVTAEAFSPRVHVEIAPDLDTLLPARRVTEVVIELVDGTTLALAQPNPIGDTDHFPLDEPALRLKLQELIGPRSTERLEALITALKTSPNVADTLVGLAKIPKAFF